MASLREITNDLGLYSQRREEQKEQEVATTASRTAERSRSEEPSSPPASACPPASASPSLVTLPLRREGEREVGRLLELDTSSTSLLDISRGEDLDTSGSTSLLDCSIFSYASPDMLRTVRRRSPRVDLFKLRLDFL